MMYIGNDLIESVQLDNESIPRPGYVGSFKRNLKIKYNDLIKQCQQPPDFLVAETVPQNQNSDKINKEN